jgi:hypothetical protein
LSVFAPLYSVAYYFSSALAELVSNLRWQSSLIC